MRYHVTIAGTTVEVEVDGDRVTVGDRTLPAALARVPGTPLRHLLAGDRSMVLAVTPGERGRWGLVHGGNRWEAEVVDERTRHIRSLTAGAGQGAGPGVLRAPMPGLVVRVLVEPGQAVTPGAGLIVLEAMKMENELKATTAARILGVRVHAGEAVEKGAVLVDLESGAQGPPAGGRTLP